MNLNGCFFGRLLFGYCTGQRSGGSRTFHLQRHSRESKCAVYTLKSKRIYMLCDTSVASGTHSCTYFKKRAAKGTKGMLTTPRRSGTTPTPRWSGGQARACSTTNKQGGLDSGSDSDGNVRL